MHQDLGYFMKEFILTFSFCFFFNILSSLISGVKIDFAKIFMATLLTSLVSIIFKLISSHFFYFIFNPIHPAEARIEYSLQSLILNSLLFSLVSSVVQLLFNNKKLSLKNIFVDTSNTVKNLSNINMLSEMYEISM